MKQKISQQLNQEIKEHKNQIAVKRQSYSALNLQKENIQIEIKQLSLKNVILLENE